ncbi:hypothetical protein BDV96DRAFT_610935 [Lophiotrema nucula]|uniref:Uncharacterized protein n=1 Tax=Lophiotrema nucula TaxID=690887 RepID=A0A6A5ZJG1_9PLEO|nr:hypothetical protein BDV96DRAFT_610935 [Lophiotrema nucula]
MLALLGGLVTFATATPVVKPRPHQVEALGTRQDPSGTTAPCAQVSQAIYFPNGTTNPDVTTIPAEVAYNCLNSVPFNATAAKQLLKEVVPYINWQSTLNVLKNPPAEYAQKVQPAIDILGGLDKIAADIDAGLFTSEYDFGWTLYTLIQSAHDGHFSYIPDSVGTIFGFSLNYPLVSVSEDGKKLPAVFAFKDVLGIQFKNITYTPSAITKINGQDATKYLETLSQYGSLQDRDALYNNLFYSLAQVSLGLSGTGTGVFTGGGRGRFVYRGPTTTFTFANGSTSTLQNQAQVRVSFRNITSGEDLARRFFYWSGGAASSAESTDEVSTAAITAAVAPGYPSPIVAGPSGIINGFYVGAAGYEDVAVLQVPNFVGETTAEIGFQKTTKDFLARAKADGKKKLIIDVQANGGGTILQGYDMFKQLFPSLDPYGANRFRATEAADLIGQSFSAYGSQVPRGAGNASVTNVQSSYFNYQTDTTVDGKPFASWKDKFGPVESNGDKYTSTSRWNLSDVLIQLNSGGINITGYGPLANAPKDQVFEASNIVLLTDGYCASTCTIFSEFLTKQGGVKTIALGGRSNKNQIQAIGGVKGTNNFQWGYIQDLAQSAVLYAPPALKASLNGSVLVTEYSSELWYDRASGSPGVNVRDGLLKDDKTGTPLQFIYENANCRLYYTPEMTVDATAMWKAAADAQWGNSGKCVSSGGYGRRASEQITTTLKAERVSSLAVSNAAALKKVEAFEKTFDLGTDCKLTGDGFMQP